MNARRDALPEETQPTRFVRCAMGRVRRNDRGGAALEFAIILPFFLAFVFMVFELGMMFAAQELLDSAARNAARSMRIGTYTGSSYASTVKTAICSNISSSSFNLIQSCGTSLKLYVSASASSTTAAPTIGTGFTQLTAAPVIAGVMTEAQGTLAAKTDVLLELGYSFPWVIVVGSGNTLLTSIIVFQTEPY
jgi:Flp pilus assembly protein TadG